LFSSTRPYRHAILVYLGTIVLPVSVVLWMGVQSFERQRQVVAALTAEKLNGAVNSELFAAAADAFAARHHPIAKRFFIIEDGVVVKPAIHPPPPHEVPAAFADAEHQELQLNRLQLALRSYRRLVHPPFEALALSRVARVLSKLGREEDARATWRLLADRYPDECDLSGRPFGIIAALNSGETRGLEEQILSGRWDLPREQAEFFLSKFAPNPKRADYLDQFRLAEEITEQFRPPRALRGDEIASYEFAGRRILYRQDGPNRIVGFEVNAEWVMDVRARLQNDLNGGLPGQGLAMYAGAVAVVLLVLSAGIAWLWRDVSRQTRLNKLRADFVNGVSHELKTPITLIRMYGETLLQRDFLDEVQRRDFYRVITRESTRLGTLVERILTFSRIERATDRYELELSDLAPLIARVVDDYADLLQHAGFVVTTDIPPEAPLVRFDAAAVSQALVNLLDNAAKYSATGHVVAVRVEIRENTLAVVVQDHGPGIAAHDQERIFDAYVRAENASSKGGYGLGLFLVRHIMQSHGGRVEVESKLGQGSTFRLIFPLPEPEHTPGKAERPRTGSNSPHPSAELETGT
jgi:signal transduction histidine kinase